MATGNDREDRLLRRNLNSATEEVSRQLEELRHTQQLLASKERQIKEYERTQRAQTSFSRNLMDDSIVTEARQTQKGAEGARQTQKGADGDGQELNHPPPKTPKHTVGNSLSQQGDYSLPRDLYRTIDNLEQSTQSRIDISEGIRDVDERLSLLKERSRQPFEQEMSRKEKVRTQEERDRQKLDDKHPSTSLDQLSTSPGIPDKEDLVIRHRPAYKYSTPDLKYRDIYFEKLDALELREKEVERWSIKLRQKEENMIQIEQQLSAKVEDTNEAFRQRDNKLTQYEQHLNDMQTQMNKRLNEMEERFEEREKQLLQQQISIDTKTKEAQKFTILDPIDQDYVKDTRSKESKEIERKIKELETQKEKLEAQKATLVHSPADKWDRNVVNDSLSVKLNLTSFSGKEPVPRNEASYEEFKIEFESVSQIYSEQVLRQALRKCLKEQARKTMWHLGSNASVKDIMKALENTFGNIASEDILLSKFLLAEQKADESIIEWGLRLEEIMLQVSRKAKIDTQEQNSRLKNRFWRGLRNEELKHATRVHFESLITYEELRNKVRSEEYEMQLQRDRLGTRPKTSKINQIEAEEQHTHKDDTLQNLVKQMETLTKSVEEMKRAQDQRVGDYNQEYQPQEGRNFQYRPRGRGYQRGFRRGQSRSSHNDRRETAENETKKEDEKTKQSLN